MTEPEDLELLVLRHQVAVLRRQAPRPPARAGRQGGAGGAIAAAAPTTLADILRHPSNAAARAPRADRPPLDIPARPLRAATHRRADPDPGAAPGRGESDLGTPAHPRRAGRARLPSLGQHRVERPAPGRFRYRALPHLTAQAHSILECDSFTVDTTFLKRIYVLFFVELSTRQVHVTGMTAHPIGARVTRRLGIC
jgi:putative transposase